MEIAPAQERGVDQPLLEQKPPTGVHAMHSVFYATGHLAKIRVQPLDSVPGPVETKPSALEFQARICSAILLVALSTSCTFWLIGSFA
ncbi:hypothetical protein ACF6ZU_27345 [Pseudomonas migulae]|uniref:hypothetical protein n=1 Tax=Pseudomonas migulae TaxID=78543 RepID=UPI00371B3C97